MSLKTVIVYQFEPTDPPLDAIKESSSVLYPFIQNLDSYKTMMAGPDGAAIKSYLRITNGETFKEEDVRAVADFLKALAARAVADCDRPEMADNPWKERTRKNAADAILAADNLLAMFYERAPNLKPIATTTNTPA